jgi:outer membrane biosynthesis protein TonB
MKKLLSLTLAFALGVAFAVMIVFPKMSGQVENAPTAQTAEEIQTAINEAVNAAVTEALAERQETAAKATETPQETDQTAEPITATEAPGAAAETETAAEIKVEPAANPTEKPAPAAKPETKQISSPPVQAGQYPIEFYIDGQKYAYLTPYAEQMGQKTLIADESEPASTQLGYYDPSQDPLSQVKGPFN